MDFQEFQQQVLSLDIFSKETTVFNDRSHPKNGVWYEAQDGFNAATWDGKFQVLINGSSVGDDKLKHEDIHKAALLAERRANCFQMIGWQQEDTFDESTFDYSV